MATTRRKVSAPPVGMSAAQPSNGNGFKGPSVFVDPSQIASTQTSNQDRGEKLLASLNGMPDLPSVPIDEFAEYGITGLKRVGGTIFEEFLPQLQGDKAKKIIREMSDNDATINCILFAIEMLCRMVEWRVDPASKEKSDELNAQFVRECMDDMSHTWADFISEALSMLRYGYAPHEIVYKMRRGPDQEDPSLRSRYDDGKVGWRKLPIRSQDSLVEWVFDEEGGVKGYFQRAYPDWALRYIPIEKSLLFRTTSNKNNPEGKSIIRGAYRSWYFKKRLEEIEGIGVERDLAGLPMVTIPADMFNSKRAEDKAVLLAMQTLVKQIRNDEQAGIVFPMAYDDEGNKLYDFSLVSTGGTRMFDTTAIIQRYDERIAMTVLADFVFLGGAKGTSSMSTAGSYAMSSNKTDLFKQALSAWLDTIAEVFNRHALPRLFKMNNIPQDALPKIAHENLDVPDLDTLGAFIQNMMNSGWADILSDNDLRSFLLKRAQLPLPSDLTEDQERWNDANRIGPEETPDESDVLFAGPTGTVRISPDGKTTIEAPDPFGGQPGASGGTGATPGGAKPGGSQGPATSTRRNRPSQSQGVKKPAAQSKKIKRRSPNPNEKSKPA